MVHSSNLVTKSGFDRRWENYLYIGSGAIAKEASIFLNKMAARPGVGPVVYYLLDFKNSIIADACGDFEEVLGVKFSRGMSLMELISRTTPEHLAFLNRCVPPFISYFLDISDEERQKVGFNVEFQIERKSKKCWINQKIVDTYTDDGQYRYTIFENYDCTSTKVDQLARCIVYHQNKGYLMNESYYHKDQLIENLTSTELTICSLITKGKSDKEIAEVQFVQIDTIKQHKKNIFTKLGINKSTELVALAYESGIVSSHVNRFKQDKPFIR